MNNYSNKINLLEDETYKKHLDVYLKHSIFEMPELGETIYGNMIIHKIIQDDEFMECKCVKITTLSEFDKPFVYIFINDPNNYIIEKIFAGDDSIFPKIKSKLKNKSYIDLYRPVEISTGIW